MTREWLVTTQGLSSFQKATLLLLCISAEDIRHSELGSFWNTAVQRAWGSPDGLGSRASSTASPEFAQLLRVMQINTREWFTRRTCSRNTHYQHRGLPWPDASRYQRQAGGPLWMFLSLQHFDPFTLAPHKKAVKFTV